MTSANTACERYGMSPLLTMIRMTIAVPCDSNNGKSRMPQFTKRCRRRLKIKVSSTQAANA